MNTNKSRDCRSTREWHKVNKLKIRRMRDYSDSRVGREQDHHRKNFSMDQHNAGHQLEQQPQQHLRQDETAHGTRSTVAVAEQNYNLKQKEEKQITHYHNLVLDQRLVAHQQHRSTTRNYEQHHQHGHDITHGFYSTEQNTEQSPIATAVEGVSYQTYPSEYETAIEAAKPSYNILPYDTTGTSTQNNDAVNALIGEYFSQNSEAKENESLTPPEQTLEDAPVAEPALAPINGYNYVQPQQSQIPTLQHQTQLAQNMLAAQNQFHQQTKLGATLAPTVRGAQRPFLPPIAITDQQQTTDRLINATVPESIDVTRDRQVMDAILKEQSEANDAVKRVEDELQRVKEALEKAKAKKRSVDERVSETADSLIDSLLKEDTKWNNMYKKLVEFREKEGHCDVMRNPYRSSTKRMKRDRESLKQNELVALGTWVGQNRLGARRPIGHPDRIEPYKVIALDRIGFDWQPRENYWMDMYQQLKLYLQQNNGKMPSRCINGQKNPLGQWCDTQVENYRQFNKGEKKAYISEEKISMLNDIGFVWDRSGKQWMDNYEKLKAFKKKHGHCKATPSKNGGDKSFGLWVTKQKRKYINFKAGKKKDILSEKQAALLDELDFVTSNLESASKVVDAVIMHEEFRV